MRLFEQHILCKLRGVSSRSLLKMSKNYVTSLRGEAYFTPTGKLHIKDEPVTPIEEDFGEQYHLDDSIKAEYGGMRKSLSMNDIASLTTDLMKLGYQEHSTEHSTEHRHRRITGTGDLAQSKTKYVSMAEAIYHYHRDTPNRFHSSRPQVFRSNAPAGPSGLTRPQSPMLRCKARSRPVHILSQKEKEELEAEEARMFKIKANPIPKSVIEGCRNLPEVPKKMPTVPEPFNLTEVHKKINHSPVHVQAFKARPAPKHILEKPQVCPKQPIHVTKPVSPKFQYKPQHLEKPKVNSAKKQKPIEKPVRHGPIMPKPFSFEKRDEELKRRHEERIKQQLEEERKQASQFKAQPLPGAVKKRMQVTSNKCGSSTASSENKENRVKFEARPPIVLYKEPFKPVLKPVQLVKPTPFNLNTEKRAVEREIYDKTLKCKEEEQERLRQQKEKEMLEAQERENAKLRAKLVHHPKPAPTCLQPFIPEPSGATLTVPETPKFIRRLKQH
ncbi:targeting protein for Xklp2 homolog [Choristoneura fumiferana]|uniref:targeting protein for Xklp2 homolog n=1 Tax=Choristoneura fumiferana TaxID=7141 RepID=UPI003D1569C8